MRTSAQIPAADQHRDERLATQVGRHREARSLDGRTLPHRRGGVGRGRGGPRVLAPRVEQALSGAGWETTGSESVQARQLIDRNFDGFGTYGLTVVVHAPDKTVSDPAFGGCCERCRTS